ncbi:hypothetical protein HPP92_014699 [Vanilla planifolia]|uniref:Pentatricopeptide repeat-containing protein n=1 Tax=Vanilla planifolia TaxID=51239 RepID=A0A835UV20_VANPL|nr:hypothetical protein HPP92_014699 [Vanilla planifolia]
MFDNKRRSLKIEQEPSYVTNPVKPMSRLVAATNLIKFYFDRGLLSEARRVFDDLADKDVVAWTAMISGYASNARPDDAWSTFCAIGAAGVNPNAFTVSSILTACKTMEFYSCTCSVHAVAVRRGVEGQLPVENALMDAYSCSTGGMDNALQVFAGISERNAWSWTTIIAAYVRLGDGDAAVRMCRAMFQDGIEVNPYTLSISIRACTAFESLVLGRQIHSAVVKSGHGSNLPVSNSIIYMYSRCMSLSEAWKYFYEMPQKDLITWNAMIAGLDHSGSIDACRLLLHMFKQSAQPNLFTFCSIISSCANLAILGFGLQIHGVVLQRGFRDNQRIANALVDMYAKCGSINDSQKVFNEMCQRDLVSWTSMVIGYGVNGYGKEAIDVFNKMIRCGIQPDLILLIGILSACSHAGLIDEGLNIFTLMESKFGIKPNRDTYGCVVDLLGRHGKLSEAYDLIEMMPFEPDESIWGALLGACKVHRNVDIGRLVAKKMLNLKPGAKTYVILSNIYAAHSKWAVFAKMRKQMRGVSSKKEVHETSWLLPVKKFRLRSFRNSYWKFVKVLNNAMYINQQVQVA